MSCRACFYTFVGRNSGKVVNSLTLRRCLRVCVCVCVMAWGKYAHRRHYGHRRRYGRVNIQRNMLGMPSQRLVSLRQHNSWTQRMADAGSGPAAGTVTMPLLANCPLSITSPLVSGWDSDPLFWEMWSSVYSHYTVVGVKFTLKTMWAAPTVTPTDTEGAVRVPMRVSLMVNTRESIPDYVVPEQLQEQGLIHWKDLMTSDLSRVHVVEKFSAKKFFGLSSVSDDPSIGAPCTTYPAALAWFLILVQKVEGTPFGGGGEAGLPSSCSTVPSSFPSFSATRSPRPSRRPRQANKAIILSLFSCCLEKGAVYYG
ncbi:putative capsid protein [Dragonfly larvae associated circular virus-7]|uniref:putative capsid protein n=1 Tax=Dragonfly larvae associated circular virus-7 TaxID=1454028 RepID=UPI0003E814F9|nr:putative capsid protein [Dragonfly larvae associated circular virus-7]AHH31476.1 putative capsid protein [Dragonfly larvae associated circular virus-7]